MCGIRQYFLTNGLLLNPPKRHAFSFETDSFYQEFPDTYVNCDGVQIYLNTYVKNLRGYFNRCMLFDVHITELNKKVTGILMFINRISDDFDIPTRKIVVQSLVLSVMNYRINTWSSCNKTLIRHVQKLQNFVAKIVIGGARKYDHVTPLKKRTEVADNNIFEKCTMVYKVINGLYPEWFLKFQQSQKIQSTLNICGGLRSRDTHEC